MDKISSWWHHHRPTQRRLIQLYTALLYNAHLKGFSEGSIYTGVSKAVCVPGLNCYSCPGAVGACPLGSLQNALSSAHTRMPYYVLGLLALFGLTLGRVICGFLCPVGLAQELLHKIPSPKVPKSRFTRALSFLKYAILLGFVLVIPLYYAAQRLPMPGFCKYICPAGTLEGAVGLLSHPDNSGMFSLLNLIFTRKFLILIALVVASVFIYRVFCRFICPLGAIYGFFSRIALLGVRVDAAQCTGCGQCKAHCPMDIRYVGDHECIQCGACRAVCPTKAIHWQGARILLHKSEAQRPAKKKWNWKLLLCWVCLLALLLGALMHFNQPAVQAQKTPTGSEVGMLCPDFTVTDRDGTAFSPAAMRGKVVVINFWATWCTPCCNELPYFQQLWERYGQDVSVIALHSSLVTDDWNAYLSQKGYTMPFALDEKGEIIAALGGGFVLPQTIILDQNGVIVYNQAGSVSYDALEALVLPLLKGE